MKVYLMESGDYEQRGVSHVIATLTDAPGVLERAYADHQEKHGPITIGTVEPNAYGGHIIKATYPRGAVTEYEISEWEVETA